MADFIEGAGDDGFFFISFGTILVQMSQIPEVVNAFFEAVRGRKTRFLWKWDVDPPKNTPENIFTAKWFPQQDLLGKVSLTIKVYELEHKEKNYTKKILILVCSSSENSRIYYAWRYDVVSTSTGTWRPGHHHSNFV